MGHVRSLRERIGFSTALGATCVWRIWSCLGTGLEEMGGYCWGVGCGSEEVSGALKRQVGLSGARWSPRELGRAPRNCVQLQEVGGYCQERGGAPGSWMEPQGGRRASKECEAQRS